MSKERIFKKNKTHNEPEFIDYDTFCMHNITENVLEGLIDLNGTVLSQTPSSWSSLSYEAKTNKIIKYCEKMHTNEISDKQYKLLKAQLLSMLSKRKLNDVIYDVNAREITNVPCVEYDSVQECYKIKTQIEKDEKTVQNFILNNK